MPGGDLRYYRLTYLAQKFFPISRFSTLQLGTTVGYAAGYQDNPLPFYKNFYAGGVNSVRGFYTYGIGPRDEFGLSVGGPRQILGNLEYYFPFPGADKDKSLRLSAFVDAGIVDNTYNVGAMRFSAGLSLNWFSPVGPLKLSYGYALNDEPTDKLQRFQFSLGTMF